MGDNPANRRSERRNPVFAYIPEYRSRNIMNRDVLSVCCIECARQVRESRRVNQNVFEYADGAHSPTLRGLRECA
jgi:hypothetical protein